MKEIDHLCPGCMRELQDKIGTYGSCPHCGYVPGSSQQNHRCLSVHTILAGKYLVGGVLGQGGFGITYMGYDLNMETRIAIKEYFPVELVSRDTTTMTGDRVLSLGGEKSAVYQQGLQKYVDEARNVSQFSQIPGVVSVKDFFYENETAYIVMEYIEGQSLKDYLRECGGKISEEEALRIMKPVLEALEKVHEAGIIHRDISPDNIMLTFDSEALEGSGDSVSRIQSVKLIDFGAARMTAKNDQKSLTIILKHGYAPEEQYRTHGEQGPWTDVYAVCAVLYRMMTGETPVPAMDRLFQDELKSLEALGVNVSAGTSEAVLKGLAVKKEDRIQNMQELIGALYEGTKVRRTRKKERRKLYAAAGIGAAAVLAAMGIAVGSGTGRKSGAEVSVIQEGSPMEESESLQGQGVQLSERETLGEQIVFYDPKKSISVGSEHVLICLPDGTVTARGENGYGQCDVEDWTHVAAVRAGSGFSVGLRTDGTVLYTGLEEGKEEAASWKDIVDIQASNIVMGLRSDGTVIATDSLAWLTPEAEAVIQEVSTWTGIKAIALSYRMAVGLKEDGTVLIAGWPFEVPEIRGWKEVESLILKDDSYSECMLFGIGPDDSVKFQWLKDEEWFQSLENSAIAAQTPGEYERLSQAGQLRLRDICPVSVKEDGTVFCSVYSEKTRQELESWSDLEAIAVSGNTDFYGLKKDGTVLEYWENAGNAEPDTMSDLQWVQVEDQNLYAGTKDGGLLTYGKYYPLPAAYDWREPGRPIRCLVGRYGILYEDGTLIFREEGAGQYRSVSHVRWAKECWSGKDVNGVWSCAYLCISEDGTCFLETGGDWEEATLTEDRERLLSKIDWIKDWTDIVQITSIMSAGPFVLRMDGSVTHILDEGEYEMELGEKIVGLYKYEYGYCVLGLTEQGSVVPVYWESGVQFDSMKKGMLQVENWTDITQIAVGESHTAGLRSDGTVIATGRNYAGQCDVDDWTDIVYLAAGKSCTFGITADGKLKMAGSLY